jgi:hypothetical protein
MRIRSLEYTDFDKLKEMYEKHFKKEFVLPDFLTNFLCSFVVEDDIGIITISGIRTIVESVAVTNKDRTPKDRLEALYQVLDASTFVAERHGYDQIHVFVQDKRWENRLKKMGFYSTKGQSLVLDT